MGAKLLVIDPQNDFCDIPGAALPVPGADADMRRLAAFIAATRVKLTSLIVTLDSHPSYSIERTTFWVDAEGKEVAPFTVITEADLQAGKYRPRDETLRPAVQSYLATLERKGHYQLMVWPVHCVVGTWGHNVHEAVAAEVAAWERASMQPAYRVLKGMNPMTEQYSAVRAEVPDLKDIATQTNMKLVGKARPSEDELLFVAGEAASHCVAATLEDLLGHWDRVAAARVVVLSDCMSAVPGCEEKAAERFRAFAKKGVRIMTSSQARALLDLE